MQQVQQCVRMPDSDLRWLDAMVVQTVGSNGRDCFALAVDIG